MIDKWQTVAVSRSRKRDNVDIRCVKEKQSFQNHAYKLSLSILNYNYSKIVISLCINYIGNRY